MRLASFGPVLVIAGFLLLLEPQLLLLLLLPSFRVVVGHVEVALELPFVVGDVAIGGSCWLPCVVPEARDNVSRAPAAAATAAKNCY